MEEATTVFPLLESTIYIPIAVTLTAAIIWLSKITLSLQNKVIESEREKVKIVENHKDDIRSIAEKAILSDAIEGDIKTAIGRIEGNIQILLLNNR